MKLKLQFLFAALAPFALGTPRHPPNDNYKNNHNSNYIDIYQGGEQDSSHNIDNSCVHGPSSRHCWHDGFNIDNDFQNDWPTTGKTVKYVLTITNSTCNPDGHEERICFKINNQYPGPTIQADWGDYLEITVVNQMQDNGTGIHWHGVRQYLTNPSDGTNGVTECPIAPGHSKIYLWHMTQFGTSWYHSHHTSQYGEGIFGMILINGPATAHYDVDLGTVTLNEWYYQTCSQINYLVNARLQTLGFGNTPLPDSGPPLADNILINGTNKDANGNGEYLTITIESGKRYRLRIGNVAVDNAYRVSMDNHPFEVIASDFVPVEPFTVNSIMVDIGQRYDVIITANQTVSNYWFRVDVLNDCSNFNHGAGRAIFNYAGAPIAEPTASINNILTEIGIPPNYATSQFENISACENPTQLKPRWPTTVPSETFNSVAKFMPWDVYRDGAVDATQYLVYWGLNNTAIDISWEEPVLSYVWNGNTSYPALDEVIQIPTENKWTFWIMQDQSGKSHPMHLHGHDFYVLGSSIRNLTWTADDVSKLQWDNPPRRDTATLPGLGWLVIAFISDNPGAWLMHCHIAWHSSEGLGVVFLEGIDKIPPPPEDYYSNCAAWDEYSKIARYPKMDSGL